MLCAGTVLDARDIAGVKNEKPSILGPYIFMGGLTIIHDNNKKLNCIMCYWGFPSGASGKELTCQCRRCERHRFNPQVGKIPWKKAWQPTPLFLPGESHGQRNLVGYCPWGHKELDMTEVT